MSTLLHGPIHPDVLIVSGLALAVGTYGFRLAGPLLRTHVRIPAAVLRVLEIAPVVLLAALVATTGLTEGHGLAGPARPLGVAVAGVLAWRKAPFLVIVLGAAATTALLRLAGMT
jgi:branched-subunit amino acid transport protein